MSSSQGRRCLAIGIFAVFASAFGSVAGSSTGIAGELENGVVLAKKHCARCHVIGDGRTMNGLGSAPSFRGLVNNLDDWEERFATFFARPPHPAFVRLEGVEPPTALPPSAAPVEITAAEADAIQLYARSLRAQ